MAEEKVREELRELRDLWDEYRAKVLGPHIRQLRKERTQEAIDAAIRAEDFEENIESLFIEVEEELEVEVRARERGDEFNAVIAAQRAAEALEMLRVYAKSWREKVSEGGWG